MEELEQKQKKEVEKKLGRWKNKLICILFLIVVIEGLSFWFYYQSVGKKVQKADEVIKQIEILNQEKQRCSDILMQTSGEFADYEYCKKLLQRFLE
ncbi:hypothetical protein J7L24_01305 [bacterium]|nr:hypothetical protein [bacterium]